MKDIRGKKLKIGDTIVFGNDNGSTLNIAVVTRLTPAFVWMKVAGSNWQYRRAYDRVAKIKKVK